MTIAFPLLPQGTTTTIGLRSSAVDQTPYLGGPMQRLSRLGDRWRIKIDCRPMWAPQAGPVVAALVRGLAEKVALVVPQPGLDMTRWTDGTVVGAVSGGRVVRCSGGGAAKQVGQYVSIVKAGVRYLHQIQGVDGDNLTLNPMLKVPLSGGEVMEFGAPKIEGFISGNEASWTIGLATNLGLSFEVVEAQ